MATERSYNHILISDLLNGLTAIDHDQEVRGIALDSRKVKAGDLFLACHGRNTDGSKFINDAILAGAVAIAIEADQQNELSAVHIPFFPVHDLSRQAGVIAARFYGFPSREMNVVGVTGTNGKTSVAYYVAQAFAEMGKSCGLVGTLGYGMFGKLEPGGATTPDPVTLQCLLSQWHTEQIGHVVMEVSSHALDQGRITGIKFDIGVLTNLSRDHLDYHVTMPSYANAKRILFEDSSLKYAIVNLDDEFGRELALTTKAINKIGYSINAGSGQQTAISIPTVFGKVLPADNHRSIINIESPWGQGRLETQLIAQFNVANLLASLSILCVLDIPFTTALESHSRCGGVPGRMECFGGDATPLIVVDYAHSPDALKQILIALRPLCRGRLVCVFGCGGERDKGKRSVMGKVAEDYADDIVLTNDNPRGEAPGAIIEDILAGIANNKHVNVETDRATAITQTIMNADQGDIVVVAGKGHETCQEIAGRRYPFSDRELVRRLVEEIQ